MITKQHKSTSMARAVLLGDLAAGILTIIMTAAAATMLDRDAISEETVNGFAVGTHFLSTFAGAWTAGKISDGKSVASVAGTALYFLVLITAGIFGFGGALNGIVPGMIAVVTGGGLGIIAVVRRNKHRSQRKRKMHSR